MSGGGATPDLAWLAVRAVRSPDAPALQLPDGALTWAELAEEARGFAASLARSGVGPGDIVATLLGSVDFARWVHAVWLCGATVLPLNLRLTAPEIVFQLRDAGARFLLHGRADLAARALRAAEELPGVQSLGIAASPADPGFRPAP